MISRNLIFLSFLFCFALAQDVVNEDKKSSIDVAVRAPSDYLNCNCQCDSYTWSDGKYTRGNCKSKAKLPGKYTSATGLFCYVSGSALCSCRDVQVSKSVTDSYGRPRYYSFEACTTPPRNRCNSYGSNFGDGDFPFCVNSGSGSYRPGSGSGSYRPGSGSGSYRPGSSSGSYRPGSSSYRPGSSSGSYRPGSSSYRPGSSSGSYRPGSSNSNYGSTLPFRGSSNSNPSLDDILNGNVRDSSKKPTKSDAVIFDDA